MKKYRFYSIFLLLLNINWAWAQDKYFCEQYPFIRYDKNVLEISAEAGDEFDTFFEKLSVLETKREGKVNILHFGDSHIQADYMPNQMRHLLRMRFPMRDRGMIFPFAVAKSNNPHNYIVDYAGEWIGLRNALAPMPCNLGVTGMSVTTRDPLASIQISQPESGYVTSPFTRIRVFHSVGEGVPAIVLSQSHNLLYKFTNETFGYTLFLLKRPVNVLSFTFDFNTNTDQEITLYGISLENVNAGFTYSSLGVNGAKVTSLLKSNLLEKQLMVLTPDMLIFSYGTNEVYKNFSKEEFEESYNTLLKRIRAVIPDIPILLTTPGDALRERKQPMTPELNEAIQIIYKVAKTHDCAVWNFYDVMGGEGSIEDWYKTNLTNQDKLHFIRKGYELQAELLYDALMKSYEYYLQKR